MESTETLKIAGQHQDIRLTAVEHWLRNDCGFAYSALEAMAGDASFRRYFRLRTATTTYVVMDAPPPKENCYPYVTIAQALLAQGVKAPAIIQSDLERGFLVITDFGDLTYLNALTHDNADNLYQRALATLAVLQAIKQVDGQVIPAFSAEFMQQEWAWHKEWFLDKFLHLSYASHERALDHCYGLIVAAALEQPHVFMHRDYHSANLMVLPDNQVGVLDFQDAFIGPVLYDAVSLLRDCYVDWPTEQVEIWAHAYKQKLEILKSVDARTYLRWFDLMGMQRHLKALLTFARKHVRDQQSHYLQFIPRTLGYLLQVSQAYPELASLHDYLRSEVQPALQRVPLR